MLPMMPCVPGVSWPALQKEAGETRISPCFPCNFGPHVRHRRAGKGRRVRGGRMVSPDIGKQVCCYCVVAYYSSTTAIRVHSTRLTASISVSQVGNVTQPKCQQALLVPAGLPQARDTYHCPPLPQNSNALQRQANVVVVVAAAVVLALSPSRSPLHSIPNSPLCKTPRLSNILDCLRNATRITALLALASCRSESPALPANHWLALETLYSWGPASSHSQSCSLPKLAIQPLV